jgi:hypothetical protein
MFDELKQLEIETQSLIDELALEMKKADETAEMVQGIKAGILDSDAAFKIENTKIESEIEALMGL